jgi:glycosyltransferase involved in cell wall biosynthesis
MTQDTRPDISVVVPAFNEENRLEGTLRAILGYLNQRRGAFEILVIDDGSTDRTAQVAESVSRWREAGDRIRLLREPVNRGKGFGVRSGMLAAHGRFALMTDADLSTPIEELDRLQDVLDKFQADLVFGSRDIRGSRIEIRQPRSREILGKSFNRFIRLLTGIPYRDTQCGFKLFRMSTCRGIFERQRLNGFAFDVELLFIARKWNLKLHEVPVTWSHCEGSKVSFAQHAPSILIDLARLQLNNASGAYNRTPVNR